MFLNATGEFLYRLVEEEQGTSGMQKMALMGLSKSISFDKSFQVTACIMLRDSIYLKLIKKCASKKNHQNLSLKREHLCAIMVHFFLSFKIS